MPKFNVILYPLMWVRVPNVEASTAEEAAKLAEESCFGDLYGFLKRGDPTATGDGLTATYGEFADEFIPKAIVDPLNEDGTVQGIGNSVFIEEEPPPKPS